jgi:hypothetical protein
MIYSFAENGAIRAELALAIGILQNNYGLCARNVIGRHKQAPKRRTHAECLEVVARDVTLRG